MLFTDDIMSSSGDEYANVFVRDMLQEYGIMMLDGMVPNRIDGFKKIHRRIINTVNTITEDDKMTAIIGSVMKVHPHGDLSIEDSIKQLIIPYGNIIPLIHCDSGVGMYSNTNTMIAARYLDIQSHPFTRNVFFDTTHQSALKRSPSVTGKGDEPTYFVPCIPYALMVYTIGMGPGFKTEIYPIGFKELCDLTLLYIKTLTEHKGSFDIRKSSKLLLPDFPTNCLIRNHKQLTKQYKQGVFNQPIIVDGTMTVTKNTIMIHTLPPGIDFMKNTGEKIREDQKNKVKWTSCISNLLMPSGKDISDTEGICEIQLTRGTDPFKVLDIIKKRCKFNTRKTPNPIYTDETGKGDIMNQSELLDCWYKERYNAIRVELKVKQKILINEQRKCEALLVFKDNMDDVIKTFRTSEKWEDACDYLHKKYKLTPYQSKFLKEIKLETITKTGRLELQARLDDVINKLQGYNEKFNHINERMLEEVNHVYKSFGKLTSRHAHTPKYFGYVKFPTGVIQCWNKEEIYDTLNNFKNVPSIVKIYSKASDKYKYILKNSVVTSEEDISLPKEFSCDDYYTVEKPLKYICGVTKDDKLFVTKGLRTKPVEVKLQIPVGDEFISIDKAGVVKVVKVSSIKRACKTDIIQLHNNIESSYIIAYMNNYAKNEVRFKRINIDDSLEFSLETILLNIPSHLLKGCKNDVVFVKDIPAFFNNRELVILKMNTLKTNTGVKLKKF